MKELKTLTENFVDCRYAAFDFKFNGQRPVGGALSKMDKIVFVQVGKAGLNCQEDLSLLAVPGRGARQEEDGLRLLCLHHQGRARTSQVRPVPGQLSSITASDISIRSGLRRERDGVQCDPGQADGEIQGQLADSTSKRMTAGEMKR